MTGSAALTVREAFLQMIEGLPGVAGFVGLKRLGTHGGAGHFSLMMTATDSATGERLALKFFNPERAGDTYRTLSFRREADLLAEHGDDRFLIRGMTRVVDAIETFEHPVTRSPMPFPFSFYAMELARGSVQGLLARGPLPTRVAVEVFNQMCRCVQYVHARGICHRDIKPENFLIVRRGAVRLADLGTARDLATLPIAAHYDGAPGDRRYAPLEQLCGLLEDDPSLAVKGDVFGLGATLFELLTGELLASYVYEPAFIGPVLTSMSVVGRGNRRAVYDGMIQAVANSRPLPTLATSRQPISRAVRERLDDLYRSMTAMDYRRRTTDFRSIFRQLEIVRIILRNESGVSLRDRQAGRRIRRLRGRRG